MGTKMRAGCFLSLFICAWGAAAQTPPPINIKRDINSPDTNTRNTTADAMARMADPESLDLLLIAIKDKELKVAQTACQSLATRAQVAEKDALKKAVSGLVGGLKDTRAGVREAALNGLTDVIRWRKDSLDSEAISIVLRATDDPESQVRAAAIEAVAVLKGAEAFSLLASHVEDHEPEVKSIVVRLLGEWGDERAIPTLYHALSDTSPSVRVEAAKALGSFVSDKSTSYLVDLLRDTSGEVRVQAAKSLGRLRVLSAVEPLLVALYDPQKEVKLAVISALGEIKSADAVRPLIWALSFPDKEFLNANISKALIKIGDSSVEPLVFFWRSHRTGELIGKCDLVDDRKSPELFVILTLREIATEAATEALLQEFPVSGPLQACILSALRARSDKRAAETLLLGLQSQEEKVRAEAMNALFYSVENISSPEMLALLPLQGKFIAEVLLDPKEYMREAALKWFEKVTPGVAALALPNLLDIVKRGSPRGEVISALWILESIGDAGAEELLLKNLESLDLEIASAASFAAANLNSNSISKKLIALAKNPKSSGRIQALRAISTRIIKKGEPTTLESIAPLIEDSNFEISFLTARALGASRNKKYVPQLLKFLASSDFRKTRLMTTLLVLVSPEDAMLPLLQALQSSDAITRMNAAWALGQTRDKRASKPLQEALQFAFFKDDKSMTPLGFTAVNAAAALGALQDPEALPTLEVCLSVKYVELRANCTLSFAKLGGSLDTLLLLAQKDKAPLVQRAAIFGLYERISEPRAKQALETIAVLNNDKDAPALARKLLLNTKAQPAALGYVRSSSLPGYFHRITSPDNLIKYVLSDPFGDLFEPDLPAKSDIQRDYLYTQAGR
jgi:HEAT repeat protein